MFYLKKNIQVDAVIGVSAGAIHGCNYVSKQKERSIDYYQKCRKDYRFLSFKSFFKTGNIVDTDYCYHEIPDHLYPFDYNAFKKSKTKFYVTVTNVETGKAEYLLCTDLKKQIDFIRASASMSVVSQVVSINDKKYLDGGISDSIPLIAMQKLGYDKCIVVKTRPKNYQKGKDKLLYLEKIIYKKYPNLIKTMRNRYLNYNATLNLITTLEEKNNIIVIEPSKDLKIGRLEKNMKKITQMYELGKKDTYNKISTIEIFLKN